MRWSESLRMHFIFTLCDTKNDLELTDVKCHWSSDDCPARYQGVIGSGRHKNVEHGQHLGVCRWIKHWYQVACDDGVAASAERHVVDVRLRVCYCTAYNSFYLQVMSETSNLVKHAFICNLTKFFLAAVFLQFLVEGRKFTNWQYPCIKYTCTYVCGLHAIKKNVG